MVEGLDFYKKGNGWDFDIFSFYLWDRFGSLTFILGCVAGGMNPLSRSIDYGLDLYSMGEMAGAWTFILRVLCVYFAAYSVHFTLFSVNHVQ